MIYICVGIPGCGKSTWARQKQKEIPGCIRLNRDELRLTLLGLEWKFNRDDDAFVADQMTRVLVNSTHDGRDVILDNTNLKPGVLRKQLNGIGTFWRLTFVVFDASLDTDLCLARNLERAEQVPEHVIRDMSLLYKSAVDEYTTWGYPVVNINKDGDFRAN